MFDAVHPEEGHTGGKGYKPSRLLFFIMLGLIVASLVLFIVVGPLKGGGESSGTSKSTPTPAASH